MEEQWTLSSKWTPLVRKKTRRSELTSEDHDKPEVSVMNECPAKWNIWSSMVIDEENNLKPDQPRKGDSTWYTY